MDITGKLIDTIKDAAKEICKAIEKSSKGGTITFQRTHSILTIHKHHITSVLITETAVRINTDDGREAFYAVIDASGNTDYLAAVATLAEHDYYIPSFVDLEPTHK